MYSVQATRCGVQAVSTLQLAHRILRDPCELDPVSSRSVHVNETHCPPRATMSQQITPLTLESPIEIQRRAFDIRVNSLAQPLEMVDL